MSFRSLRFRLTAWYAGLLALSLILAGSAVYLGLARYLEWSLRKSLADQARTIGETVISQVKAKGETFVINEVTDYAPEINGRFIRITRPDGSILYQSGPPKDRTFAPGEVPLPHGLPQRGNSGGEIIRGNNNNDVIVLQRLAFMGDDDRPYLIETGASYRDIQKVLRGLLLIFAIGMPLIVAAAIGGGYFIMRQGLAPVNAITQQAERISSQNFGERLPILHTGDELESLTRSLNRMISRLEEAFDHINRFSADVSHELRTPLTILRGELEGIAREHQLPPDLLEATGSALEEIARLAKIVDHLLIISRLDSGEALPIKQIDLGELTASTIEQLRLLAEEKSVQVEQYIASGIQVEGDPLRLRQVVVNLLDNAIKYTPQHGRIDVSVDRASRMAILTISDTGMGISPDALPHIFERFYREDKARSRNSGGAGLGLCIVKAICTAHSGTIHVRSRATEGTSFRVELPLSAKAAAIKSESAPKPASVATRVS